mgnify:CR=1 FL=1
MSDKGDARLFEQAIRNRWNIPEQYKEAGIRSMMHILANPESSERAKIAAFRAILAAESQNQSDEHHDDQQDAIDESRNRFLEIAERLGIRKNPERVVDRRTANDPASNDTRIIEDGRRQQSGETHGREAGEDS